MTHKDIVKALEICFIRQTSSDCSYCKDCPLMEFDAVPNCQLYLIQQTISKLNELVQLVDDKVNHHYYDTIESYQEMNAELQSKLDKIESILNHK